MKIIIKNLKKVEYNVEVSSEKISVLELKKEIEKVHGFDSAQLKLLFNGVVLKDDKTLEEYKVQEESVIIMMNTKVKPQNAPQGGAQEVKPPENKKDEAPKEQPKPPEKKEEPKSQPQPQTASNQQNPPQQQKPKKPEPSYENEIKQIMEMGIDRAKAEQCVKAAKGNVNIAIEFVYNGIPEGAGALDMMMDQPEQEGEGGEPGENEEDESDESILKKIASVFKVVCQNNSQSFGPLIENLQQTAPEYYQLMVDHEDEFKALLEAPINDEDIRNFRNYSRQIGLNIGGGGQGHQGGHHGHGGGLNIQVTEEERAAINRLKELGNFSEADALQAYFAFDKNEEAAANYLFEQKMKDDDEMYQNPGGNNQNNNNNNGPGGMGGMGDQGCPTQ